jgi:hypothetical protein
MGHMVELEQFLLQMRDDFAFIACQRRLRVATDLRGDLQSYYFSTPFPFLSQYQQNGGPATST